MTARKPVSDRVIYRIIGDRIALYRKANEYSQADFARMLGISQSAYSRLELGHAMIRLDQLVKLAHGCKTRVRNFVGALLD